MGGVLKSLLKETIQAFPEKETIKGSNVEAMLKKKGVKPEEIKFAELGIDPQARYTKEDLVRLEEGRKDVIETVEQPSAQFNWVSLHDRAANPTYKEKVITFSQPKLQPKVVKDSSRSLDEIEAEINTLYDQHNIEDVLIPELRTGDAPDEVIARLHELSAELDTVESGVSTRVTEGSRYTSEHFPKQENYLMHNRVYDDTLDGTPTRVLQEIQSDLHQQGRQLGYGATPRTEVEITDEINALYDEYDLPDAPLFQLEGKDYPEEALRRLRALNKELEVGGEVIPESPFQKTWLRKGIERELVDAVNEGREQLAIPIKGTRVGQKLHRSQGVQNWYENQVLNTAKKVAKASGADFELKTVYGKQIDAFTGPERAQLQQTLSGLITAKDTPGVYTKRINEAKEQFSHSPYIVNLVDNIEQGLLSPGDALEQLGKAKTTDAIKYAVIKPKKEGEVGFSLYSTPVAGAFATYQAYKMGYSEEDVRAKLAADGHDEDDIDETITKAQAIQSAIDQGYTEEEVRQFLMGQQPQVQNVEDVGPTQAEEYLTLKEDSPWLATISEKYNIPEELISQREAEIQARDVDKGRSPESIRREAEIDTYINLKRKVDAYKGITDLDQDMSLEDFVANLEVVAPNMSSITTRTSGYFGSKEDAKIAAQAEYASRQRIIELAKKEGIQLEWFDPRDPEIAEAQLGMIWEPGQWLAVKEDGTKVPADPGFWATVKSESGEIKGAILGGVYGGYKGAKWTPGGPFRKAIGGFLGSLVGAAGGAGVGSQFDYLSSAIMTHQNLNSEIAAHRALTAAEASIIGDIVAYPVAKGLGYGWDSIVKAKNYLLAGNKEGARIALRESMMVNDEEIEEILNQLQRVADVPGQGSDQAVASFVLTQPGGEEIMRVAGALDTAANRAVAKGIDTRAKDLLETSASITDENIGKLLREDLANYTTDVKQFYNKVKAEAAQSPHSTKWSFDYAKLAIEPVLEQMQNQITDVPALERFLRKAEIIRARADGRTFTDLLDLRELVNSFRFGRGTKKAAELKTYKELIKNIDEAINEGSEVVMEQPKRWRDDYSLAKLNYAKMKELEKNVLFRALNRPGINEATVTKALTKYITAIDETWTDVMEKLPQAARHKAEGAVINTLADKFTAGVGEGMRAVNFPMLADELGKTTFTSPNARKLKGAITRLGNIFKNDVPLSQHTGNIIIPREQSYLTTDPVVRAKFEAATTMFNYIKRLAPTKKGRSLALIMRTADLLENPLNVKSARELMDEVGDAVDIGPQVLQLQRAAANKAAKSGPSPLVHLYGDGKTLGFKGTGKPTTKVHMTRIASPEDVEAIAEAAGIHRSNTKALEHALKQRGFQAMLVGSEKVKLL